ncbi:MAG: hypothetical protein QW735_00380 [archaeon]
MTPKRASENVFKALGSYTFLFGMVVAIIAGIVAMNNSLILTVLPVIGLISGLLSVMGYGTITKQETSRFLVAAVALMVTGVGGEIIAKQIPFIGIYLANITQYMALLAVPAAVIIAIKEIWDLGVSK